ncbi:MAG: ABC transporter ATP-binding protein [Alphaproteobacteria bacterium]|nr:ABC transporter ATP-binding protein [Alphaproteobacteria bacterium]
MTEDGEFRAVDGVSFELSAGGTLGIVGESGCGKSVTALSIMGLVPDPPGRITGGEILFDGIDLARLPARDMRDIRGDRLAMIFQEPMTSLNPSYTVGDQIAESLVRHRGLSRAEAHGAAVELLGRARVPAPKERADDYPHRLSGGMRQRAMIAMALACGPRLLIADEPTTALDVTVQAQILDLLRELRAETGMAMMLITHDLGVVADSADEVAVMYAGRIVERAKVAALFDHPQHPYTIGLLGSIPRVEVDKPRLDAIGGTVPMARAWPRGCRFRPRCPFAIEACVEAKPSLREAGAGHAVACHRTLP